MNKKIATLFSGLLLIASIAVYAHGTDQNNDYDSDYYEYMDEMHEEMTENLDPELREARDRMHNDCMGSYEIDPSSGLMTSDSSGFLSGMMDFGSHMMGRMMR
ncbi:hypothetical protein GF327_07440 [Candidatus Woesearchaeota archaeon]|nr:hypothetical protein [Candidatus Woesearchaeota archaeon]